MASGFPTVARGVPSFEQWFLEASTLTAKELLQRLLSTLPDATISWTRLRTIQQRLKA